MLDVHVYYVYVYGKESMVVQEKNRVNTKLKTQNTKYEKGVRKSQAEVK